MKIDYLKSICQAIELQNLGEALEKEVLLTLGRGDGLSLEEDIKIYSSVIEGLFDRENDIEKSDSHTLELARLLFKFMHNYAPTTPSEEVFYRIIFAFNFALSKHYNVLARLTCKYISPENIRTREEIALLNLEEDN